MESKGQGQTGKCKQQQQQQKHQQQQSKTKGGKDDRFSKRTHSEVSSDSLVDMGTISVQLNERAREIGILRQEMTSVLKRDDIKNLITETVANIIKTMS